MEKLRLWLEHRGFELEQTRGAPDEVELLSRVVTINASAPYQKRVAALIHECGHVRIFLRRLRRPGARVCGVSLREDLLGKGRCDHRGRSSRICLLQEEMEAWDSGEQLAKALGVRYERRGLEKTRTSSLMTYVEHAASRMRTAPAAHRKRAGRTKRNP